jgi:hypothetical protein
MVPPSYGWQQLHDFVRPVVRYKDSPALKRKWVSEQLLTLERADLLRREGSGGRPAIVVLRDDSSGNPLDDPGIEEDTSYVTVHGSLFSQQRVADWGTPQVAAYLAAMIAERYARSDPALAEINRYFAFGNGVWYRPLSWFADPEGLRPANHIRVDFSEKTLGRGIRLLTEQGLMASRRTYHDPRTGERFRSGHTRVLYFNGFAGNSPERNGAEGRRKALLRGSR